MHGADTTASKRTAVIFLRECKHESAGYQKESYDEGA